MSCFFRSDDDAENPDLLLKKTFKFIKNYLVNVIKMDVEKWQRRSLSVSTPRPWGVNVNEDESIAMLPVLLSIRLF
jgi:hypothetical protein